ncbi:MAG TPA: hypothetical protein VLV83_16400 [Acidobacteriota bacterium]|nr:hypothetical protein [Acidobacteriota bacterium]
MKQVRIGARILNQVAWRRTVNPMIELNGQVNPILRITDRQAHLQNRRDAASSRAESVARSHSQPVLAGGKGDGQGVVNFEYVPSGRVRLNQEERQHLIDFFE